MWPVRLLEASHLTSHISRDLWKLVMCFFGVRALCVYIYSITRTIIDGPNIQRLTFLVYIIYIFFSILFLLVSFFLLPTCLLTQQILKRHTCRLVMRKNYSYTIYIIGIKYGRTIFSPSTLKHYFCTFPERERKRLQSVIWLLLVGAISNLKKNSYHKNLLIYIHSFNWFDRNASTLIAKISTW